MAANILGGVTPEVREGGNNLANIKAVPTSGPAAEIFNGDLSTAELVTKAQRELNKRSGASSNSTEFQEIKAAFSQWQSKVNAETYKVANPLTPLQDIPREAKATPGKEINKGGLGVVYEGRVKKGRGKKRDVVVKRAKPGGEMALRREAEAGEAVSRAYAATNKGTLLSDVQGLPVTVVPIQQADGTVIQERINGPDGSNAIFGKRERSGDNLVQTNLPHSIFSNGFVDDPQTEIGRVAGFVLGLHALHRAGKVHHDLKTPNMMVQEQSEGQFQFRVIDLGGAVNTGDRHGVCTSNGAPEYISPRPGEAPSLTAQPSYDMYTLGTMLPALFFGQGAGNSMEFFGPGKGQPSQFVQHYRQREYEIAITKPEYATLALQVNRYEGERQQLQVNKQGQDVYLQEQQQQLDIQKQYYNHNRARFSQLESTFTPQERDAWINVLQRDYNQIQAQEQKLTNNRGRVDTWYNGEVSRLNVQFQSICDQRNSIIRSPEVQDALQGEMRNDMLMRFTAMNQAMQRARQTPYPDPVLKRLAQMTADCLAMDPDKRPTAEQVLLALQNMGLSNWGDGSYSYMLQPESGQKIAIRKQFPWIDG
jgi:serine/threonine protein kinase